MTATSSSSSGSVTWSVEPATLATVSSDGKITGVSPGSVTVRATIGAVTGSTAVEVLPPFIDLMVEIFHVCARSQAKVLYCWGEGLRGQLGKISPTETCNPSQNPQPCSATPRINQAGGLLFKQIASTCGLTDAGEAYCWGPNWGGILGSGGEICDAGSSCFTSPVKARGTIQFKELAATWGGARYCGLDLQGLAYCWGTNVAGQLGAPAPDVCNVEGTVEPCSLAPSPVSGGHQYSTLSAGQIHTCGLTAPGDAYCWGWNQSGQLGNGAQTTGELTGESAPVAVVGGVQFVAISAGYYHTCALTAAGVPYCWGNDDYGQLGIGTTLPSLVPVAVTGGLRFASITTGDDHTCGLTVAGEAYCWGRNTRGQLGDGTYTVRWTPTRVAGAELVFVELRARRNLTCGRVAAGFIYCWGWNAHGQLGGGDVQQFDSNVPVGVGAAR